MKRKRCLVVLLCFACLMTSAFAAEGQDIESLIKQLGDSDFVVRGQAVSALVQIGKPAMPALIGALGNKSEAIWRDVAATLVQIGKPAVPALVQALNDEDARVRGNATFALGQIGFGGQFLQYFTSRYG